MLTPDRGVRSSPERAWPGRRRGCAVWLPSTLVGRARAGGPPGGADHALRPSCSGSSWSSARPTTNPSARNDDHGLAELARQSAWRFTTPASAPPAAGDPRQVRRQADELRASRARSWRRPTTSAGGSSATSTTGRSNTSLRSPSTSRWPGPRRRVVEGARRPLDQLGVDVKVALGELPRARPRHLPADARRERPRADGAHGGGAARARSASMRRALAAHRRPRRPSTSAASKRSRTSPSTPAPARGTTVRITEGGGLRSRSPTTDPASSRRQPTARLTNMGDRLGAIGGRLFVSSSPGDGNADRGRRCRSLLPLLDRGTAAPP